MQKTVTTHTILTFKGVLMKQHFSYLLCMLSTASLSLSLFAADVPSVLAKPSKIAPSKGKVKIYILAGQSNMVGFGTLQGARPTYPSIYLSADPKIKTGRMPIGASALMPHGIYQTAHSRTANGARVALYEGAYQDGKDYSKLKPFKETTIALGTVSAQLPSSDDPHTIIVKAYIDVPMNGTYEMHVGYQESAYAVISFENKDVYRKEIGGEKSIVKVELKKGIRYPITITYFNGGSAAFWLKKVDIKGKGDLASLTQAGKYPWFIDENGDWTVCKDVTYWETRVSKGEIGSGGPLTVTSNGKFIGPEVPFGYVMGAFHEEPVLLIESSIGNRALSFDFRPPSSGKTEAEKENKFCGLEYELMIKGVHKTLKNIDKIVPNYSGQGYEIVGFVWFQGHKDKGKTKEEYEQHLVNIIKDLRKEFNVPKMKAVIATVAFGGDKMTPEYVEIAKAQLAVGDPKQHPEFSGDVASVDTRGYWRSTGESPTGVGYHYNHNAETYVLTGDALGRAMVGLLGGKAEKIIQSPKAIKDPNVVKVYSDQVTSKFNKTGPNLSPAEYREMGDAIRPILYEEMIPAFLNQAFSSDSRRLRGLELKHILNGTKLAKMPLDIRSQIDTLITYYDVAGMSDYKWKTFAPNIKDASWSYYSFDPQEKQDYGKSNRFRKISLPSGMENWQTTDFNPEKAGWKSGKAPFGQMGGKLDHRRRTCNGPKCGCSKQPTTLWEKEVLLMQQTFDIPAIKEGHAYRLILGGAGCDRSGEGFAIYINGKLLTQSNGGFFRHPGIRGAYIYKDMLPEFKGGKVTIAIINFLRYTHFNNNTTYWGPHPDFRGKTVPPNGHINLWMEEAKLSPALIEMASKQQ